MAATSTPELLTLHGVRILGMATAAQVARRFDLDPHEVEELLLDAEAYGQVSRASFADLTGWGITDRGRAEDDRRLAAELDEAGARGVVTEAHATFARLNARFLDATTRWQIRPQPWDRMAVNDHDDWAWDERVCSTTSPRSAGGWSRWARRWPGRSSASGAIPSGTPRHWPRSTTVSGSGSTSRASTPATRSGSSCTRTCSAPWVWSATGGPEPVSPVHRTADRTGSVGLGTLSLDCRG